MQWHCTLARFSAGPGTMFELHVVDDYGNYVRTDVAQLTVTMR